MTLEWKESRPEETITYSGVDYEKYYYEVDRGVSFEIHHGESRGLQINYYDCSLNDEDYKKLAEDLEKFFAKEGKTNA